MTKMYKTALVLALISTFSYVHADEQFYAFVMHVTHEKEYDRATWIESKRMIQQLGKICQDLDDCDKNWQSLTVCIDAVVETIQHIFTLCNGKSGITMRIRLLREPEEEPEHGLYISLDSALEMTSARNFHRIETMLAELDFLDQEDEDHTLNILKMIRPVLLLSAGNVWIRIKNADENDRM
jgi:hypothetical protein